MIAVYTFWAKPFNQPGYRSNAGYLDIEMFYSSWILSVMKAKEYFDKVILYTDTEGAKLLSKIDLPFDELNITLDNLDLDTELWVIPKIITYSLQTEPFLHIDYDLFFWSNPPQGYLDKPLLCESKVGLEFYRNVVVDFIQNGDNVPTDIANYTEDLYVAGAGLYGGNNHQLLSNSAKAILELVKTNSNYFSKLGDRQAKDVTLVRINNLIEEFFTSVLTKDHTWVSIKELDKTNSIVGHMLGDYKRTEPDCTNIKNLVKEHYPTYYSKI
jgi:hypothetical protein